MKSLFLRCAVFAFISTLMACAANDASRVTQAATAPLSDLNLIQTEIPPVLLAAQKGPYAIPSELSCTHLSTEIRELDAVLGADLDAPPSDADPGLIERGTDSAKSAAVGALRKTTEGVVPFRGWVRKLSGAERHAKHVEAAITAGTVRRSFLKGLRAAQPCTAKAPLDVSATAEGKGGTE